MSIAEFDFVSEFEPEPTSDRCAFCLAATEDWAQIQWAPHYMISNKGRVRHDGFIDSLGRRVKPNVSFGGVKSSTGYAHYGLAFSQRKPLGATSNLHFVRVHRLVAEFFLHKPSEAHNIVNHKDGNRSHNCVGNLEWVTQLENMQHAYNCKP